SAVHRFLLLETTTHMLGVPPKSSGGATSRCVMSRLTKCAVLDPFQTALSQACRARSCRSCGGAGVQRLCALCLPPTGQPLVSLRRAQACSPICPDASPCPALLSTAPCMATGHRSDLREHIGCLGWPR